MMDEQWKAFSYKSSDIKTKKYPDAYAENREI